MTTGTMGFVQVPATAIFLKGHGFKMRRVYALSIPTSMVDFKAIRDFVTDKLPIGDPVRRGLCPFTIIAFDGKHTVAIGSHPANPRPAAVLVRHANSADQAISLRSQPVMAYLCAQRVKALFL